jgi:hypothetical protein
MAGAIPAIEEITAFLNALNKGKKLADYDKASKLLQDVVNVKELTDLFNKKKTRKAVKRRKRKKTQSGRNRPRKRIDIPSRDDQKNSREANRATDRDTTGDKMTKPMKKSKVNKHTKTDKNTGRKTTHSKRTRKVVRKKKTLKKRLNTLEKNLPPRSCYKVNVTRPWRVSGSPNCSVFAWFRDYLHNQIDNDLQTVKFESGNVDLTSFNSSVKVRTFHHFRLKNVTNGMLHAKVCHVVYRTDTNNSPGADINVAFKDKHDNTAENIWDATGLVAFSDATATSAALPNYFCSDKYADLAPFQYLLPREFTKSKTQKLDLAPGAHADFYISREYIYKCEDDDVHSTLNYVAKYDSGFCVWLRGEMGESVTPNATQVGWMGVDVVAMSHYSTEYDIDNGLGLKLQKTFNKVNDYTTAGTYSAPSMDIDQEGD